MRYKRNYLLTHNIDWFVCIGGAWIYAASRGGLLPNFVDNRAELRKLQKICFNLPDVVEKDNIEINEDLIMKRYDRAYEIYAKKFGINRKQDQEILKIINYKDFRESFMESFVEMACKGFYSYIRLDIDNAESNEYRLVAFPKDGTPKEIDEFLHNPIGYHLLGDEYTRYIRDITITNNNQNLSFNSNLDILF